MFEPLSGEHVKEILRLQLAALRRELGAVGVDFSWTARFEDKLAKEGYDPLYGARPIKRIVQSELTDRIAEALLGGDINKDDVITADTEGDEIVIRNDNF